MKISRFLAGEISLGKGSVKLPIQEKLQEYRLRYNSMIARGLKFKYFLHYVLPGGRTIVHVKVPSETVPGFYYDVLLELIMKGGAKKFEDCHLRIFSNCPSFVYTYAYVFYHLPDDDLGTPSMMIDEFNQKIPKNRLTVSGIESKLGETPLTEKPVMRNPYGLPLFDKSIYFALFFIIDNLDFNRTMYNKHVSSIESISRDVMDFDSLMALRKSLSMKNREQKASIQRDTKKTLERNERNDSKAFGVNKVKPISAKKKSPIKPIKPVNKK